MVTGLKDYTLTAEEKQVLDDFENVKFEEFNVVDLFDVKNSRNILSKDIIENSGETPYLCASSENNAVSSYISYDKKYLDKGNCIFIGGKTFVVTYQEKDFYSNDSHNLILSLKNEEEKSKLNQLYLVTCINKSLGHKYSWGDSISNKKIQTDKVSLPAKNQQPYYAIMETFISAIQKLVIKDVVLYANKKLDATKYVVNKKA
ncbi:restriction endonuclease subunit S [Clostridium botulinum]|uniref:restriction endonuclease subunit S n=1 Tax=Clostridium botulinum TaxID=1491 RepID=UPI001E50A7CE|nr:restriction endonuclease subunit S [Clostridium botulinum]MCC5428583.1 restriction endonuclease subunit S [Clostridium botulinum]